MTSISNNSTIPENADWIWSFRTISVLTLCSVITLLTILGNGLVLLSVKFRLHARSYSDYFIVSLCLADFFVGLFVMPLMIVHSLHLRWPYDYRLCYVWMAIDFTCSTASFLTLASMALDRYWALTAPYFHLRNRSYSSILIFIISSWAIPFAIWPGSIFIAHRYNRNEPSCVHPAPPFVILILCAVFYYIPLFFMLACYSRIIVNIKNIEVLIRGTWDTIDISTSSNDMKTSVITGNTTSIFGDHTRNSKNTSSSISMSFTSLRSLIYKYFQRSQTRKSTNKESLRTNERPIVINKVSITRKHVNEYHHITPKGRSATVTRNTNTNLLKVRTLSSAASYHYSSRNATTATFTGQKRFCNDGIEDNRLKHDSNNNNQEEEQQLVRARHSTRTSSLPAARCVSYYYYQNQNPSQTVITKAIIEDQHRTINNSTHYPNTRPNSVTTDRNRSHIHSSVQCLGNTAIVPTDLSEHSSSFENNVDEEHRRLNRHTQQSGLSTSYHSSRYSQRAVAQFMHERHKARLRRNQKASRMLGILLAVFLICWLPFIISYPTMIFYPNKFPNSLQIIIFWFGYINSLLNPFLYVYSSRSFRQAIIETLCCYVRFRSRQQLRYQWSFRVGRK
ncbi:unnamed protein product [Adineta steineri]|uniref:G-protein coupled receptors family 1 profile domain-containing protein n=1 Tax=Adineta steineri TaxID=433720 RepID=A0A818JVX4_9BILA|nr:unnamed protein product [Adineta steineri]CAF3542066.1 unnamed protein product [Adineta steineri]